MTKKLIIEGWIGINHSYAMVNQYQLLELAKSDLHLFHHEMPYFRSEWNTTRNFSGFNLESVKLLQAIPALQPGMMSDITYRIGFPFNFCSAKSERLFVYGTSEHQALSKGMMVLDDHADSCKNLPLTVVTPSNWSKIGFLNSGFTDDQVKVISHGVNLSIFKPLDHNLRSRYRGLFGANDQDFIILSVGAMTPNKGIDILLSAYLLLKKSYPQLKLVLKDQSNLYGSSANDLVNSYLKEHGIDICTNEIAVAISDIKVVSENLDLNQLNGLYNAADCYISPYRAEGFNLPPLEAAAVGIPIVVTEGGPTDDYSHPSFALKIESKKMFKGGQHYLEPNLESLVHQIQLLIDKKDLNLNPTKAIEFIAKNLSWEAVCKTLIKEMVS